MSLVDQMPPDTLDIPHEEGNRLTVRPVSYKQMQVCRGGVVKELIADWGKDSIELMMQWADRAQAEAKRGVDGDDVLKGLSPTLLCHYGIVSWEGPRYQDDAGSPLPCDRDRKEQLDEQTVLWAAEEVAKRSRLLAGEATRSGDTSATNGASGGAPTPVPTGSSTD